jgi:isoleucyl-tRNA synthetase
MSLKVEEMKTVENTQNLVQLDSDRTYSAHETEIQKYWTDIDLPHLLKQKAKSGKPFRFMDGPPFVSGSLHYGHLAVGSYKSAVLNAMGMLGYNSSYILGFDCHGLPIETKVCKEYNLTRDNVESMGLAKFNKLCDTMITDVSDSWIPLFKKFGRIADFDDIYMTRDINFMESTMWIFKQLFDQQLVYSGNKVMPYSSALETPLSNFEASQNYQTVKNKSAYVRFKLVDMFMPKINIDSSIDTYLIAWTTTPWTLASNLSLCVNSKIDYVLVNAPESENAKYILSKNSIPNLFGKKNAKKVKILAEFKGQQLNELHYVPVFDYMIKLNNSLERDNDKFFKVLCDPYVKAEGIGTGIVHQAPGFGEDDFRVCEKYTIVDNVTVSDYCPLDKQCQYTDVVPDYKGRFVLEANDDIRKHLIELKHIIKVQEYDHSYPHCYRTDTPLIYRTVSSFFIAVEPLKEQLIELNNTVTWHPKEIGSNRFGKWLENAKDWAVSRFRYYGTPIPIWINDQDNSDMICIGSIEELEELTGVEKGSIKNLHPEYINDLKIVTSDGKTYSRVPDIFDCWFESGTVPFGQIHYPFDKEKAQALDSSDFLSDFICEGLDQTRGWFYTLAVISAAVLDKAAYRNVVCTGMVLDEHGIKLSKKLQNYEDPNVILAEFGADIIRVYFVRSPLMRADPLNFSKTSIKRLKNRFVPYINAFKFLIEHLLNYTSIYDNQNNSESNVKWGTAFSDLVNKNNTNLMDVWLLNKIIKIGQDVNNHIRSYKMGHAIDVLIESFEDLTNWYLKLNRNRLKGSEGELEQVNSLQTFYTVLMTYVQLWAPFTPFLSEYLFQKLKVMHFDESINKSQSVLLTDMPDFNDNIVDDESLRLMNDLQRICTMVRNIRKDSAHHISQMVKFKSCTISHADKAYLKTIEQNIDTIKTELNVEIFNFQTLEQNISIEVKFNNKEMGKTFRGDANRIKKLIEVQDQELLYDMYSGKNVGFSINFDETNELNNMEFNYPSEYFELIPVPTESEQSVYTIIDTDLLVKVDPTYDETICHAHQVRLLHSAVQKTRKVLGIRPWQSIMLLVDTKFSDTVHKQFNLNNKLVSDLSNSLPSSTTNIMTVGFEDSELTSYDFGKVMSHKNSNIIVDRFSWTTVDGTIIEGYFCVQHLNFLKSFEK